MAENIKFPAKNSDYYQLVYGKLYPQMNQMKGEVEKGLKESREEAKNPKGSRENTQRNEEELENMYPPIKLVPSSKTPDLIRFSHCFRIYVRQKEGVK